MQPEASKSAMSLLPNFHAPQPLPPRHRPHHTIITLLLCIPFFFYHLVPSFTHASDTLIAALTTRLRESSRGAGAFCTKDIGDATCCSLFLAAAPCVDECAKRHVDRVTWVLTEEYGGCAEACLGAYEGACHALEGKPKGG
jgi:hypothetical protein